MDEPIRLTVCDVETTGLEPPAEVIELAWADVEIDGAGAFAITRSGSRLFRPLNGITPESRAVHHISPEDVADAEPFAVSAAMWADRPTGIPTALVAHNAAMEQKFLGKMPAPWICTMKVAARLWPECPSFSNQVLRYWLELALEPALASPPHRAAPDVYVTAHILILALQTASVADLLAWSAEPMLMPRCPLGKFRGKPWPEVEAGFLNWMLGQASMEPDLKWNARRELDRRAA